MTVSFRQRREVGGQVTGTPARSDVEPSAHPSWLRRIRRRESARYAGPDRRARAVVVPPNPREFVLAGTLILALSVPFALIAGDEPLSGSVSWSALNAALAAMAAVLAVMVGSTSIMRWRMTGESVALRVGVAVLLIGVAAIEPVVGVVATGLDPAGLPLVIGPAAMVVAVVGLSVALFAPEVDARLTAWRNLRRALAMVVLVVVVALVDPVLVRPQPAVDGIDWVVGQPSILRSISMILMGALAIAYTYRGLQDRRWLHTWIGLMLFALTLSIGFAMAATSRSDARLTGSVLLLLYGMVFALNGSSRELAAAYGDQRAALLDTAIHAGEVESLNRAERAAREEQTHNAMSALLAIQGAIRVLERETMALDPGPRNRLLGSLDTELNRLRELLAADSSSTVPRHFSVAQVVEPVAICRGAAGAQIFELAPSDIRAFGRPTVVAEIVDNLVANAERHAPDTPIYLRAVPAGDMVQIRVEDGGPGVVPEDRERIFLRGQSGSTGGSGLGLFVARRLARQERGDLWVEDSAQGGAAFVLTLPVEDRSADEPLRVDDAAPADPVHRRRLWSRRAARR